ncbi:glycosyl hydrolase family 8 [Paenibacillus tengchongensis]|uniref:glycosyl hydrolase family 8 n=1 Tax=Paenibacillus tengchongensis TaxID=2608684 RepID=UPI001FEB34E9|nr:glycosyl hydrolase family 8 [Paenibacillus tengchongensis]
MDNKNLKVKIAGMLFVLLLLVSCKGGTNESGNASPVIPDIIASTAPASLEQAPSVSYSREEQELLAFIDAQMTGPYGVYTNRMETAQSDGAATGHEVLSESASLMMQSAVQRGERERFTLLWKQAAQTFDMKGGFSYRYSPKHGKQYSVNAAVDDLRLIGALQAAGEKFQESGFTQAAEQYGQRFYEHNVKNGYMYDFYDNIYMNTNKFITLCYINLSVLRNLSIPSDSGGILLHNMTEILEDGYISDQFPFYETRFDYESGTYRSENINTVESMLSLLHLAEAGRYNLQSLRYIKQQVEAGTLYGQYTRDGVPVNDIRSTAIYALAAMIGRAAGDEDLYRRGIERMNEFRITDGTSPLFGGFGNAETGEAYSFDNLMALTAYSYDRLID